MTDNDKQLRPVGFNLTIETRDYLYKIADFLSVKRTRAIIKLIDILLDELATDKNFKACTEDYDRAKDDTRNKSAYTSFYIPPDYLEKLENAMYDFGFIDRSPFLRLIINYVYDTMVKPIIEKIVPKVEADLKKAGYKVLTMGPILNGDIYIHIENPKK